MLVRFAKRKASWEGAPSVEALRKLEFKAKDGGPDLRPSVYDLDGSQLVRAFAEHASLFDPPGRAGLGLEVQSGARPMRETPGNPGFALVRDQHREVVLQDDADLDGFIGGLIASPACCRHPIKMDEIKTYVTSRLRDGDPEWIQATGASRAASWVRGLKP